MYGRLVQILPDPKEVHNAFQSRALHHSFPGKCAARGMMVAKTNLQSVSLYPEYVLL